MVEADPLAQAFGAYQRGDHAACLAQLEASRPVWATRPDGWLLCGVAMRHVGRLAESESAYRQALALKSDYAEAWQNLGNLYAVCARHEAAMEAYARALDAGRAPADAASLLVAMSASAFSSGRIDTALEAIRRAVALAPASGPVQNQHGKLLWELGHTEAAIEAFRVAALAEPGNALFATNLLLVSQFSEAASEADLSTLAREAATRIARQVPDALRAEYQPAMPGGRIRIAYLSSDFRASAPGFFIRSIVGGHDRDRFEVWLLSTAPGGDQLTEAMRAHADHWEDVSALDAEALTRFIRGLGVQVLVDLNGYTGGHRLAVFSARAAPVQVSWLGYEGSTQLEGMDVFLGDPQTTPPENEGCFSERVLRLPFDFACYSPPDYAPAVAPTPALARGHVTFGSFNKLAKLGPRVLALWARIVNAVPDSRLLIKWRHAPADFARTRILDALARGGVGPGRIEFRDATPHSEMLSEYGDIDIALDPTPFSGGATTCDALWMGVPVVTLHGRRFASNHTVSHLRAAGLPELVATDEDAYVAICTRLAGDLPALSRLRLGLREQLSAAPLCSPQLFMRPVERYFEELAMSPEAQTGSRKAARIESMMGSSR